MMAMSRSKVGVLGAADASKNIAYHASRAVGMPWPKNIPYHTCVVCRGAADALTPATAAVPKY